jgi:hypothetical protein
MADTKLGRTKVNEGNVPVDSVIRRVEFTNSKQLIKG